MNKLIIFANDRSYAGIFNFFIIKIVLKGLKYNWNLISAKSKFQNSPNNEFGLNMDLK